MFAGSQLDPVIGLDIHMEMVPMPAPVPTPFPMPFVGMIEFSPMGVLVQAGIAAALSAVFSTPPSGPVMINGLFHAAKTGDDGTNKKTLPHIVIPPGTMWTPLPHPLKLTPKPPPPPPDSPAAPAGDAVFITGSKTVYFEQCNATRLGTMAMSCGNPVRLPSSVLLSIPKGMPVLVGGPPAFDWSAAAKAFFLRNKWMAGLLQDLVSLLNPGRLRDLLGWAACQLTGHPVDVATGRLLTRAEEFTLIGPIPLKFERYYSSARAERPSSVGYGWSHTFDERIWRERGKVIYKQGDGREVEFHCLDLPGRMIQPGQELFYPIDRLWLRCLGGGRWEIRSADRLVREFATLPGNDRTSHLTRIRDRIGHSVDFTYDADRQLSTVGTSEGRWMRLEHRDGLLRRLAVALPDGDGWYDKARFEYSSEGDLVKATDSLGHARHYRYERHLLIQETDRDGIRFWFEYDGRAATANCVRTWGDDAQGGDRLYFREITYDKMNKVTLVEDSGGNVTTYKMNALNAVVEIVDPNGGATKFEYDDRLWKTAEFGALGDVTRFAYDSRGNETLRTLPNRGTFRMSYDADDQPVELVDPFGTVRRRQYDAYGRVTLGETPAGLVRLSYAGRYPSTVEIGGRAFAFEYDALGQATKITLPDGSYEERTFDRQGRLTKTRDGQGRIRRLVYDWESRVVQIGELGGLVRQTTYSPEGDVTAYEDPVRRVRYGYRGYHKLGWREGGGTKVEFRYTAEDDLITILNEAKERYVLARDACGRVVEEVGFDGRKHTFVRNAAGWVVTMFTPSKQQHSYEYDAMGWVSRTTYGDGSIEEFTYDLLGNLESASNGSGTVRLERDAARRVIAESFNDAWVASKFDGSGRRVELTSSLGLAERITRGPLGEARAVGLWEATSDSRGARPVWGLGFEYDDRGYELRRTMGADADATLRRDEQGLPLAQVVSRGGAPLSQREYSWLPGRRLASVRHLDGIETRFEEDERQRLVAARSSNGRVQWRSPGPTGNLFKTPDRTDRRYGKGGVLLKDGKTRYGYDGNGNLVQKVEPDGSTWSYGWDGAGRLARVTRPDGEGVTFAYDALGRRISKTSGGRVTRWVWDRSVPIHEVSSTADGDSRTTTWVFEPESFAPLGKVAPDGETYTIVTDYLGTPHEMLDDAGKLAWKAQLDIYGVAQVEKGNAKDCPWRWQGQYDDEDIGLSYNRFRYYDPSAGRYISQDPIRLGGGLSRYRYVENPLELVDPLGLADCKVQGIHDDTKTKGVHIDAPNGVELKVLPAMGGDIVFKPVFSGEPPSAVAAAIKAAENDLENDAGFRAKLLDTAERATRFLADNGCAPKSAETNFLAAALRGMG